MSSDYIIIGGDLVPTKSNIDLFIAGEIEKLVGVELMNVLSKAYYRIFNLEVPLTEYERPIIKQGPNLIASPSAIEGYKELGTSLLTMANNHILDQGEQGLKSTITTLKKAGINYIGAGPSLKEASKPLIFNFQNKKVGVIAFAEHEFSIAKEDKAGANPFDPLWSLDLVCELKNKCDFIIVLYHGGKEHYRYPSPYLQKVCRRLIDKGADIVICQHSHCIGCEEKYRKGTIIYGQGNFIFDDCDDECWQTSLLVKIECDFTVSYIPIVKNGNTVRLANEKKSDEIMDDFYFRSGEIKNPNFIESHYTEYSELFEDTYLRALSGECSLLIRILNKLSRGKYMKYYFEKKYGIHSKVRIANYIDCEAHRELLLRSLSKEFD